MFASGYVINAVGVDLYRRPEDSMETTLERMETYRSIKLPVIRAYAGQGLVRRINGIAAAGTGDKVDFTVFWLLVPCLFP